MGLELPVIYKIYGRRKYLDRLDELIHGSETAKRALREKDEGILIDGQKKRKSTKKDKDSLKKQKKSELGTLHIIVNHFSAFFIVSAMLFDVYLLIQTAELFISPNS